MASDTDLTNENGSGTEDAPPKRPSATASSTSRRPNDGPRQGGTRRGPARVARRVGAGPAPPRSGGAAGGAGADAGAGARPDPLRPDARLAVHVLPRRRVPDGSDLASGPRTGLHTQLCGDAHLSNFGGYAAPDRRLVFSLNDFDETLPGPFEWDVKRLVASFAVAGRDRGFDPKQREKINHEVGRAYRESIRRFAAMTLSTSGTRGSMSTSSSTSARS